MSDAIGEVRAVLKVTDAIEAHPVIRWLMTDGRRLVDPSEFLEAFAHELRAAGVDVSRITTGVPILHPQIFSFSGLWQHGKGTTERRYRTEPDTPATLLNSPIGIAYQGRGPVRCDLTAPPQDGEFVILADLRREGFTDYIVHSIPFADGSHKALSLATSRRGGFTADELALFEAMIPAFAFNLEVQALRRTARTLLDTYVGPQAGGRVLEGQIQRGTGETIGAVIWLCDLAGFTGLSETLERDVLIDLLNCYFGPMCNAVTEQGGEILKFIGDAMLAIFPIGHDAAATCGAALSAAGRAQAALIDENLRRKPSGLPRIDYGLALHVGDVMYGNIGSDTRLDFTVIGPAVNLTARIESMCRQLGSPLLLSSDFVRAAGIVAESLGKFSLKGVGVEQELFVPVRIG
ncbi:MAG: adenylate/guanylate cyclase domain-containing protein [Bradyrhizobium sp.]|uniref:adenylate/guanylate cyclase domain-containing protein n=1 Tax=Bradyrhizobium sp. TaxID=376 RepID=UPI001219EEED|nr:adenylate/guanylate cyclase domain-containing protein [Bradyrhizobium sp.]THD60010.1 MAG: adenylate/guanylate cyclase domain-containing protein [Bradyrhizobium sp.]